MPYRSVALLSLVFIPMCTVFALLGLWQWDRMHDKQHLVDQFELATKMSLGQAISEERAFARVRIHGKYETDWHLLLDNRTLNGRVGVHVLSLFRVEDDTGILVNRGWLPMAADRRSLPEVKTPDGPLSISGMLASALTGGVRLGEAEKLDVLSGSKLVTYLDIDQVSAALNQELPPWLIQLDQHDPSGFEGRNWQPAVMIPGQHRAYAVQWFALALAFFIMYITLSISKIRKAMSGPDKQHDKHSGGDL